MEGVQGRSQLMGCLVVLSAPPDLDRLRTALAAVVEEQPLLRTRMAGMRRVPAPPEAILEAGDEAEFANRRMDLANEPPYRLLVNGRRLLLMVHHSVMDGLGAVFFFDRLAAYYTGHAPPLPPPPSRRYRSYFFQLPPGERLRALLGMARSLRPHRVPPAANVAPAPGPLQWRELLLDPAVLKAQAPGNTLNDVLLGLAVQALGSQSLPVRVFMTISLRHGPPVDLGNRSADFEVVVLPGADVAASVKAQTPAARDRVGAVIRIFQRAVASYVPRGVMVKAMEDLHARPENAASSLFFSNVGDLKGMPGDFGELAVEAVGFLPPLLAPPGVAVLAATTRGRLLVTVCALGDVAPLALELETLINHVADKPDAER